MTPADLRAWQTHMGYSLTKASAALGINLTTYTRMLNGSSRIDRRTALACAAIAARLDEWAAPEAGAYFVRAS